MIYGEKRLVRCAFSFSFPAFFAAPSLPSRQLGPLVTELVSANTEHTAQHKFSHKHIT